MRAVGTNVLVRALVRDDPAQAAKSEALLGNAQVFVPVTVILELEWVLRSRYGFVPKRVAKALEMLAGLGNVMLHERDAVLTATQRVAQGWDFADALHHALSGGCDDFVTLDADLARRAARATAVAPAVTKL
jgi:predicted nucleic-acid-binding protein